METRHPVEGQFGSEFWRSVIVDELWRPEVAKPLNVVRNFCISWKTTTYVKILLRKFNHDTD